jgi:AGCS family alanine or glycine:cation symporter
MPIFEALDFFENFLWGYIGLPVLMILGIYLSFRSNFVQIRKFPSVLKTFIGFLTVREQNHEGVHPLKAFFACIGGCVGVGNIVGICTAVQIGGPGALFWVWVTAIVGTTIKYSEVFLGLRYRVQNKEGGYDGGPMYFLRPVFKNAWMPALVTLLLCIYGVEIYQFSIVTSTVSTNFDLNPYIVSSVLLLLVMYAGSGGVRRVGNISSAIIPVFVVLYIGMGLWVLAHHLTEMPGILAQVFTEAFTGSAATGGFAGSTLMMAMSQGIRRGCYTGDLGIGYASVIHSESSAKIPEKQASLVIFDIFMDTFLICTSSVLVILATGVWQQDLPTSMLVQTALSHYFPYMHYFMPIFLFLLGYSTINAYFCVGLKCAHFISPTYGRMGYYVYACCSLFVFSFVDSVQAQTVMTIVGGLLLAINCYGIYTLRQEISYDIGVQEVDSAVEEVAEEATVSA